MKKNDIKALIFDWGDTIMRDFPEKPGPMYTWDKVAYIPGAETMLQQLYQKYTMVIATNAGASDTQTMIKALQRVGADKYFQYFFSSKDLGYEKPDVRFFETISTHIGIAPGKCVMIGNIYDKDITGARACGMSTIFFNEKNLPGTFPDAALVIQNLEELSGYL